MRPVSLFILAKPCWIMLLRVSLKFPASTICPGLIQRNFSADALLYSSNQVSDGLMCTQKGRNSPAVWAVMFCSGEFGMVSAQFYANFPSAAVIPGVCCSSLKWVCRAEHQCFEQFSPRVYGVRRADRWGVQRIAHSSFRAAPGGSLFILPKPLYKFRTGRATSLENVLSGILSARMDKTVRCGS